MNRLVDIAKLRIEVSTPAGAAAMVDNVSLVIEHNQSVGLVGESGSGKSLTARAILGLAPAGGRISGTVHFDGRSVLEMKPAELRRYRAKEVGIIFQDPRAHINPVRSIGDFMIEVLRQLGVDRKTAGARSIRLLEEVGVDRAPHRLRQYPHELSGGLLQRVAIAAALLPEPALLIADEPTTALDVTTQATVMALINDVRALHGLSVLFISHDLELAAAVCETAVVMYAGTIAEVNASERLFTTPAHPYSAALAFARPVLSKRVDRLVAIPGRPVSAAEAPAGCPFSTRCAHVTDICQSERPQLRPTMGSSVACHRAEDWRRDSTRAIEASA